jgi:putative SOS response-associated peptidase YedK
VIANTGQNKIDFFQWGLIPAWAKDAKIGSQLINARAETLAGKPAFRAAYRRRRCLVLADGFYEWRVEPGQKAKTPLYIQLATSRPFAFAGLWEAWQSPQADTIWSCAIITTTPNTLIAPIHNRMPVILPPSDYARWLAPTEQSPEQLQELLKPYPAAEMTAWPVSKLVNDPNHDVPECIAPK